MEFLKSNLIETTTSIVVDSNTITVENILTRDPTFQYVSDGFSNDATTTSIVFNFDETLAVSRIALDGLNIKGFDIFYNGVTANTLSLTSTADTTTSQWSTNSQTSMFLRFAEINATSLTFDLKTTQVANSEKAIGYVAISDPHLVFPRIPSSKNYKPKIDPKETVHKLSDGSKRLQRVSTNFDGNIKFKYISTSFRNSLKDIYDLGDPFIFVAFGTSTGWDGILYEVIWSGPFDFYRYSDDAQNAGFSGTIRISETR